LGRAFWQGITAMGGPERSPGEALAALKEAMEVIRLAWSEERGLRYDGEHYALAGYQPGPTPAHRIEIWLGVTKPRGQRLTGRVADGSIPSLSYVPPDQLAEGQKRIDAAAEGGPRPGCDLPPLQRLGDDQRRRRRRALGRPSGAVGGDARRLGDAPARRHPSSSGRRSPSPIRSSASRPR
jgi:hypothetical protein